MCVSKRFKDVYTNYSVCDRRRTVSIKEKGKNYIAENINLKQIAQYHIDDSDETSPDSERCDYAIYIFDENEPTKDDDRLIFIELKGSNVKKAIEQIKASFDEKIKKTRVVVTKVDARIITSQTPNPNYYSTERVALENKLIRHGKGNLIISTMKYKEDV